MKKALSIIGTLLVCFGSGWRFFTFLKHTNPSSWFSSQMWALGTLSVFAGVLGSLIFISILLFLDNKR
jgi:hypothetical protein